MENKENLIEQRKISRYPSIDLIRGIALFLNVFVHLFTDVFDTGAIISNLFSLPISMLLLFIMIGYFGSYGSFFIMISGTGNMVSMQKGLDSGKPMNAVIMKQIIGGFILLFFSMLVEGLFQFYGYLGTIFEWNGHAHDVTRIIWHAYSMTPVTCLAVSMIITGIVQYFLSLNKGYAKYKRNIIIYIILAILVVVVSQPMWDLCKAIGPEGFPNAHIGGEYPGDYKVFMPPPDATFTDYFKFLFLAICGGSNHPIFPYLAMAFVGNVIGILLVSASKSEKPNPHLPKYGMLSGILVFTIGVILIPILGVDFDSILPVNAIGDITLIHGGLEAYWIPWWCFLLAGEIFLIFLIIRLIEYRGIGKQIADKTTFLRRFGVPAFSVYAWHRFWAIPAVLLISFIAGEPSWESGSITGTSLGWGWTIVTIILVWISCTIILKAWEKIGYIGGIEWMIGETAALFGKNMRKTKGTTKDKAKWWEYGRMDIKPLFYDPNWINIIEADDEYHKNESDSLLAYKLSIMGFFFGIFSIFALRIGLTSKKTEGLNQKNQKAIKLAIIGIIFMVIIITVMSLLNLGMFGIEL